MSSTMSAASASSSYSSSSMPPLPVTTFGAETGSTNVVAPSKANANAGRRSKKRCIFIVAFMMAAAVMFALGGLTVYFFTGNDDDDVGSSSINSNNGKNVDVDVDDSTSEDNGGQDPSEPIVIGDDGQAPVPTAPAPAPAPVFPPVNDEEGMPPLVVIGDGLPVDGTTGLAVPHDVCHGDCDADEDCAGHLVCFRRDGGEKVPGCAGGLSDPSSTNYCINPVVESFGGSPPQLQGTSTVKLGACQGDCDHDWDCEGHLVCHQRDANEDVPGCSNGHLDASSTDFCIVPSVAGYGENAPRTRFPLHICEGRCTADVDCGPGLVCRSHAPGSLVPGCRGRVALPEDGDNSSSSSNRNDNNDDEEEQYIVTDFCVAGTKAPTDAPFALPTSAPGSDELTYEPGKLDVYKNQLTLSRGLDTRLLAESSLPVEYADGTSSPWPFHARPDAAATFADPSGHGGFAYVSNSEHPDSGEGGVGAIYFDADGNVIDYKMLLTGTRMNCGGGRSPWGTWVTNEEHDGGRIWQVDPYGTVSGEDRGPSPAVIGDHRGAWESFAFDVRNATQPRFFATEDAPSGALVRHSPVSDLVDWSDPWSILHADGAVEYLVLEYGGADGTDTASGTFRWTSSRSEAKESAGSVYPQTEGIDVRNGVMYFVCKRIKMMFTLDLDVGTWSSKSTKNGLFDGGPDQLQRIVGDERDMLYFTEEQNMGAGIHARDSSGRFYSIVESDELPGETTGLAFSPDGRYLFVAYQDTGKLFMLWRRDGKSFQADRLDVKYHHDPATAQG